ncbi:MAG TPA: hypothetical protein VK155_12750 [Bacteroidales bacterium]|jgi:hypothetical protein|nr:hypothetical protein [Bacteroidales bacterium]
MKKIFAGLFVSFLIISIAGLTSCKSRAQREADRVRDSIESSNVQKVPEQIKQNVYPLPTSAQVIKILTDLEVGYQIGITNPVENVKKYFSTEKKAINLGAFGADLSYATLYNMPQETYNYLGAIRTLTNELNMSKIYDEGWYDSIKANMDNKDRLVSILTDAFNKTYAYFFDNEQQTYALLVVGGAWVEGMYLTTNVSEAAYNVSTISKPLLEQKSSFNTYLEITQPYLSDPSVAAFVKMLDPIKSVYDRLGTSLTEKDIQDIKKAMEEIRTKIVQ